MPENSKKEALEKRIKDFSLNVITLIRALPKTDENKIFGRQIIRSSSSIGANYAEAVYAQTKQEFLHCLNISRKETNETLYWLEMIYNTNVDFKKNLEILLDENKQLLKILISSVKTVRRNIKNGQ